MYWTGSQDATRREIEQPDQVSSNNGASTINNPTSCEDGGRLRCHTSARCEDNVNGYCCHCKDGFYGNGLSCLKNDVPLRVSGKVTGVINSIAINSHLQSYVVLTDGRAYSAISPLPSEIGFSTQLGAVFNNVIGWLFAKTSDSNSIPNGYQVNLHFQ